MSVRIGNGGFRSEPTAFGERAFHRRVVRGSGRLFDAPVRHAEDRAVMAGDGAKAFERRLRVLQLVPRAPKKIAAREIRELLASRYDIDTTPRTVERDLAELSGFLPLTSDATKGTKPYGWSWLGDSHALDIPHMTPAAALAFHFAERFLPDHLPPAAIEPLRPHFERARAVLEALHREGLATWPSKVRAQGRGQPLLPPRVDAEVFEAVYTALLREQCVRVDYTRRGAAQPKTLTLHPLGLVLRERVAYLACSIDPHDDVRALRLHRMAGAALLNAPRRPHPDFDLDDFVQGGGAGYRESDAHVELEVIVSENVFHTLEETPLGAEQRATREADGRVRVRAHVADTKDLRGFLRSYGAELEVTAPPALRAELAHTAAAMADLYAHGPRPPVSTRPNAGAAKKTGSDA